MSDLKITDGILDELQSGLTSIVDQLRDSTHFSNDIGNLVGHDGLAGHMHDFANDWSVHRGKMIDGTTGIRDHVKVIDSTFDKADKDLSKSFDAKPVAGHGEGQTMAGQNELAPLPGDPAALKAKADGLSSAAEQIQQAINHMRKLADRDETVSLAIDKVRGDAHDVADNITKAQVRYAGTARALQDYAPKLESAQQRALRAISSHDAAVQQLSTAQSRLQNLSDQDRHDQAAAAAQHPSDSGEPPVKFGDTPAGRLAGQAVDDANQAVTDAVREYNDAKAEVDSAAQTAISQIKKAIHDSGLNDGFWDKAKHWASSAVGAVDEFLQKYVAPVLDAIQKIAAVIADIGAYVSMVLNVLAVFIPVLAPLAAAVDIIVLAAAALSFLTTLALVGLGDRTLGDLLNTGITLVLSALPIKADAGVLKGAKGFEKFASAADKLTTASRDAGKLTKSVTTLMDKAGSAQEVLDHLAGKVGKGGTALASKFGTTFTGTAEHISGSANAVKAFTGSLSHGTGLEQAAVNAGRQFANGSVDGLAKLGGNFATKLTGATAVTGLTMANTNLSAATDQLVMPHASYFQYHTAVDIPSLAPNVQVIPSPTHEFVSGFGGFDSSTDAAALKGLFWDAPIAAGHAFAGTAALD